VYILIFLAVIIFDQISKLWAVLYLKQIHTLPLIQNVLHLTYVENTGAAFGIFHNRQLFLISVSILFLTGIAAYVIYRKPTDRFFLLALTLVSSGAFGNLIDRVRLSYVVDFIDFRAINFAVFNLADSAVVIGVILLIVIQIFTKKQ